MNLVHDCDGNRQVHAASPPAVTCRSRTRQHIESPRVPSAVANSEEKLQELQVLMELPDGTLLEADRLATGNGILRHANGSFYDGQWSAGQATGFGRFTHTDGSTYEGQWRGNQQDGSGQELWQDGSSFEGLFRRGRRYHGKVLWASGWYEGDFFNNQLHGQGTLYRRDKVYTGSWVRDRMEGHGQETWPDGCCYRGTYLKDHRHGVGCFRWRDGRQYCGQWAEGCQHGNGRVLMLSGRVREGEWCSGKRARWLSEARAVQPEDGFLELPFTNDRKL